MTIRNIYDWTTVKTQLTVMIQYIYCEKAIYDVIANVEKLQLICSS